MAKVNSEMDMPVSLVRGSMKTPRLCRMPMLRVSISDAPIKMGKLALINLSSVMVVFYRFETGTESVLSMTSLQMMLLNVAFE